jgi:ATP-binding cassette subfamily F protein uup
MLGDYDGTIILISHDRDFLDRVVGAVVAPEGGGRWTEYAGGYSDMLAQRGEDLTHEAMKQAPAKEVKAVRDAQPHERKSVKRRLSFHEKHALETLPQTILALTEKVRALHGRLDDPGLYARDRKSFEETSAALASIQAELAAAEAKWLELEILREALEAGS